MNVSTTSIDGSMHSFFACRELGLLDDRELAVRIREEGRVALVTGERVALSDFLRALPGLAGRRLALDAAIDVALRSRGGASDASAVEGLVREHPELERAIRDAAALDGALWSTFGGEDNEAALTRERLEAELSALGRFAELERVGRGASADVYRAVDRAMSEGDRESVVALKALRGHGGGFERAVGEAARARSVNHPNVVRVYDLLETAGGARCIVQEFVSGGDLQGWVESHGAVSVREAVRLTLAISRGVSAVHARGLVHLDLKPANVLMSEDGVPKITDFGLATMELSDAERGSAQKGTAAFMAPEQFLGEPGAASPQADVYALGGILHWLLTGALPNGETREAISEAHRSGRVIARELGTAQRSGRVDRDLASVCVRALAPDRSERYASAGELVRDLESWQNREAIGWTRPGLARRARLFAVRRPAVAALGVMLFVAVAGVGASATAARHFAAEAEVERVEAEAAEELLAAEQAWKAQAAVDLMTLTERFIQARNEGLAGEVFSALWLVEGVHGPLVLGEHGDLPRLWAVRVETARGLLEQRRREGGAESFAALEMESLLAFWLVSGGEFEESLELLEHNIGAWSRRLDADDPWLRDLAAVRDSALVDRLLHGLGGGALTGAARAEAVRLENSLRESTLRLKDRGDGAQLRLLILERLLALYGPRAFDRADWFAWAEGQIGGLGLSGVSR